MEVTRISWISIVISVVVSLLKFSPHSHFVQGTQALFAVKAGWSVKGSSAKGRIHVPYKSADTIIPSG